VRHTSARACARWTTTTTTTATTTTVMAAMATTTKMVTTTTTRFAVPVARRPATAAAALTSVRGRRRHASRTYATPADDGRDVHALKAVELKEILRAYALPVSGKKADLVERVLKAREVEASGADPAREFELETRVKEDAEAAARDAMESRRAARRERRAGPGRAVRASEVSKTMDSIMATTRLVEDMKARGATEVQREFVVQKFMSESIEKSGWFMVETPEEREESALKDILGLNGTRVTRGQSVDAWVPKIPTAEFYVTAADAEGKTDLELCQMVEEGEMLQPGYVLVKCVLTQQLLDSFDDLRSVRGFATGGSSRYGAKKYQIVNQPTTVDDQIPKMIRACTPRVLTEEDVELEKAREEARVIREEAAAVEEGDDFGDMRPTSSRVEEPTGLGRVEVHTGPFKGFKGQINVRNDDGSVEATLAIFGRDTSVSLDKAEFREI